VLRAMRWAKLEGKLSVIYYSNFVPTNAMRKWYWNDSEFVQCHIQSISFLSHVPTARSSLYYYGNLNVSWKKSVVLLMYGVRCSFNLFLQVAEASTVLGYTCLYAQLTHSFFILYSLFSINHKCDIEEVQSYNPYKIALHSTLWNSFK
jgi:hypothetical protein